MEKDNLIIFEERGKCKMKIGINLLPVIPGKIGGMEQYVRNLISYALNVNDEYEIFLFLNKQNIDTFVENNSKMRKILINENIDNNMQLYIWIHTLKIDIWFCPMLVLEPKNINVPSVVTIPDIQHEFYPEFFEPYVLQWRNAHYEYSAKTCNAVLTISEYSKKTMVEKYKIPENKVYSIHLDSSQEFYLNHNDEINQRVIHKYQLSNYEYGFYPANTWKHKNHINLLKAMVFLKKKFNVKINMVFTGFEQQAQKSIIDFIKENDLSEQIKFLGYLPQEEMPYVYRNAKFLVFPSLFEGFGIPLVEAMRTKTPIVCSNAGSIPEVVEDCALLFDPTSPEDIALKILEVLNEQTRTELINKGINQAEKFSWEKCSKSTLEVFKRVLES
ncbi:glycosyltransferase family 4 protein [Ectobacillus sp. sgz5001026]|uniref:glycosyltransferase family 4 protein n=1 Tax=Ectobacillus sp. sgz5001026 TaxID=3242473 RepID=UPI0036D3B3E3